MKNKNLYLLLILSILIMSCNKQKVDTIVYDTQIYTVNSQFDIQQSMAINDGKIVAVGTNEEINSKYESDNMISFKDRFIYPGLIDAHSHFYGYGLLVMKEVDLSGSKSIQEIIERIVKFQKENNFEWIEGHGWDQNDWEIKEFPDKELLDSLFPNTPVYLTRIDGHAALVNTKALDIAGITEKTVIEGGEIILKNGKPTGVLIDNAMSLVSNKIPEVSVENQIKALLLAQKNCFEVGLTSVCDAGLDKKTILLIDSLHKEGSLKMKIYAMLNPTEDNFDYFLSKGIYKTRDLTVSSIKLYADGALGSRGAKLKKAYSDRENYSGLLVNTPEYYRKMAKLAYENGYQLNIHCIGDSAVKLILDIYSEVLKGKNDRRWRIEHSQIVDSQDFNLFGMYNIIPSVQTTHATSDMYWAEERIGKERIKNAYAYKKLLQQNDWIPNGSDFPIEKINPILGFYSAVSRRDVNLFPVNGFQTENALTREEALKAMTIWAAKAAFEENEKGSLETGKYADFIVLDRDLMQVDEEEIFKAINLATFVNGKIVFTK